MWMQHHILYLFLPSQKPISWCTPQLQWSHICLAMIWTTHWAVRGSIPPHGDKGWRPRSRQDREVSQLSELQKSAMRNLPKKSNKLSIPEALKTAKQWLTALATYLRRYTRVAEARSVNRMFSTEPSKVYAQCQGNMRWEQTHPGLRLNNTGTAYGAAVAKEEEASKHSLARHWTTLPTHGVWYTYEGGSESWTRRNPESWNADMIHAYWLKKLTALH